MFEIARAKLESEVNLVEIIKLQRYVRLGLQQVLKEKKRRKLKERTRYLKIS